MHCFGQGKSPQPHNRTVTYDLLHSTDTSCSRTAEQDTELEFEANHATHFVPHNPQRDISLPGLTPLTPETRHHRVKQWVEKTSPDDDSHVMVMADEHAQYRQHSGSFSQPRALSKRMPGQKVVMHVLPKGPGCEHRSPACV
ncbi:hypothetical protein V1264_007714 [Littorina saxatilis]|uniref:Uncharacterized protein n=1 Tax=Littorina saxatilis TaxID=31220 RepID=A0AAN9G418_9CAEN